MPHLWQPVSTCLRSAVRGCRGTDYGVPFECPLDFLLPLDNLDAAGVQYRHAGFLQHPQVAAGPIFSQLPSHPAGWGKCKVCLMFLHPKPLCIASCLLYAVQVPAHIRHSISLVDILPRRPENPFLQPNQLVGHAATVWPGIEQPDLLRVLDPLQSAAVLHLR